MSYAVDCDDDIERAHRFFVVARQSFGGKFYDGWGRTIKTTQRGVAGAVSCWLGALQQLPDIHERLMRVQVEHSDFRKVLVDYDTSETLFYCDPPYVPDTRKRGKYRYDMTLEDHRDLVEILLSLSGMVVLSGYRHNVYSSLDESGWRRVDFQTSADVAGRVRGQPQSMYQEWKAFGFRRRHSNV